MKTAAIVISILALIFAGVSATKDGLELLSSHRDLGEEVCEIPHEDVTGIDTLLNEEFPY